MPEPNEHSCRMKAPNYKKYRRENCEVKHADKCMDFVYGIVVDKEGRHTELQTIRYPKKIWTEGAARIHCDTQKGTFEAAKETRESRERTLVDKEMLMGSEEIVSE